MRLSTAIRMGSLLVSGERRSGDVRTCAIGMANLAANGYAANGYGDNHAWTEFWKSFPWTENTKACCPMCAMSMYGESVVYHPYDSHVCRGEMTIEQLADFIRTIEPNEEEPCSSVESASSPAVQEKKPVESR